MNKKKFLIILGTLVIIFGIILSIYLITTKKNKDDDDNLYGPEYLKYSNYLDLELITNDSEQVYQVNGLTTTGQNEKLIEIPSTIDGYKVTKLLSLEKQFGDFRKVEKLTIGKYVNFISSKLDNSYFGTGILEGAYNLKEIVVESDNETYKSKNGILYSKNEETLLKIPNNYSLGDNGSFTINDNVKVIYSKAFINNTKLQKIKFNESLELIEEAAFENCENLKTIEFNNSNNLKEIKNKAFYGCSELTEVVLPEGLECLGLMAFSKCSKLVNLELPSTFKIDESGDDICLNTYKNTGFKIYCHKNIYEEIKKNFKKFGIKEEAEANNIIKEK